MFQSGRALNKLQMSLSVIYTSAKNSMKLFFNFSLRNAEILKLSRNNSQHSAIKSAASSHTYLVEKVQKSCCCLAENCFRNIKIHTFSIFIINPSINKNYKQLQALKLALKFSFFYSMPSFAGVIGLLPQKG